MKPLAPGSVLEKLGITEDKIQAVKQNNDILDVFSRLYPANRIERAGHNFVTDCPFHATTGATPSFSIEPKKQFWQCWGGNCGSGGVIGLVQKALNYSFVEAYEWLGGGKELTQAEQEAMRLDRDRRTAEALRKADDQAAKVESIRAQVESQKFCLNLNARMGDEQIAWWEDKGIPADWQKYWRLGYSKNIGSEFYQPFYGFVPEKLRDPSHAEAYSIPYALGDRFQTLQWRFTTPNGMGKYHFSAWMGAQAFITRPDLGFENILVVEGAKKAMVTHLLGTNGKMQVIGLPSENVIPANILPVLQAAKTVWVLLDPDSWDKGFTAKHVASIGANAYLVNLPGKIDDHLIAGNLNADDLRDLLNRSRQMKRKA